MKPLTEIFGQKTQTFSFELFPPKTEKGHKKLLTTIEKLAFFQPDFISVTYGAGGGSREKTFDIVEYVQKKYHIPGLAHLTCVLHTKEELREIIKDIKKRGIRNILALRGDPPKENPNWQPGPENFRYSFELVDFIRQTYGDYFSIGVAGFPEGHINCPDKNLDAKYLKIKIEAGADFVITQLFFDNNDYFQYVQRLRHLGVTKRIIPGIIPIVDYSGIKKFCQVCGASIPDFVHNTFGPIQDNKNATIEAGIKLCLQQSKGLLERGAPGIHFYSLNKSYPLDTILTKLRV